MGNGKWFRRGGRRANGGAKQGGGSAKRKGWLATAANRCALSFESLEDRRMLATFLVTNTFDVDGGGATIFGSLRWAVGQANATGAGDTIVFSDTLFNNNGVGTPRIISLNGGVLDITQPVDILGPGPRSLTISQGTPESRIFNLASGSDTQVRSVEISGVTLTGGRAVGDGEAGKGGAIFNREALTMNEVVIEGNRAQQGGGGIFTAFGNLTLNRSLVADNFSGGPLDVDGGGGGGAILNGRTETMNTPSTTIINSTFTGNSGGAVVNRNGFTGVLHSTITENDYGIVSWGNPVPEEAGGEPPPETVFTEVYSSIIWNNEEADVERVGETDDDPPVPLLKSVTSLGFNIVGTGNTTTAGDDLAFMAPDDQVGVDPLFAVDEVTMEPLGLMDFGGSTDVFMLQETSPAIDKGGDAMNGDYEQRGRHFTRTFGFLDPMMPATDVGSVEVQTGSFIVDTLIDRADFIYSGIYTLEFQAGFPIFTIGGYEDPGAFSLRKAIDFATKNPGLDTVLFSSNLNSVDLIEDEDLNASPAPTIILSSFLGSFVIDEDLVIQGPEGFILEIDGVGLDTDPNTQNGTGSRGFEIDDGDSTLFSKVTMSNLTIMGGDVISQGGGIRSGEDLVLS
nr:hypothetical protein [Pirellulales bacterium]